MRLQRQVELDSLVKNFGGISAAGNEQAVADFVVQLKKRLEEQHEAQVEEIRKMSDEEKRYILLKASEANQAAYNRVGDLIFEAMGNDAEKFAELVKAY